MPCRSHGLQLWLFDRAWRGETAKDPPGPAHQVRGRPQNVVMPERRPRRSPGSGAAAGAAYSDQAPCDAGSADDRPDALTVHERARRDDAEALDQPHHADEDEGDADDP